MLKSVEEERMEGSYEESRGAKNGRQFIKRKGTRAFQNDHKNIKKGCKG